MKTVIHVWTHACCNVQTTNAQNYWGLGDIIRGTIKLFQLSKKLNFKFIVDIQLHPISKFLHHLEHTYSNLILTNKNNIEFLYPGSVENYITHSNKDVIYFLTNDFCDENLDTPCKEFIKNIFIPVKEFSDYIFEKNKNILNKDYNILHYRLGDSELVNNNNNNTNFYKNLIEHLKKYKEDNDILISDSITFKNDVKQHLNICVFDIVPTHIGYDNDANKIKDTLFEFFMITQSKKIKTYSIYDWISGFVFWIHKVYDIPLVNLK